MAEVPFTVVPSGRGRYQVIWVGMGTGDFGAWWDGRGSGHRSMAMAAGTVTAASVEGVDDTADSPLPLHDRAGAEIAFTKAAIAEVVDTVKHVRPFVTTGAAVKAVLSVEML